MQFYLLTLLSFLLWLRLISSHEDAPDIEQSPSEEKSTNNLWTDQLNKIEYVRSFQKRRKRSVQELAEKLNNQKVRNRKKRWSKRARAEDKELQALKNKY